IEQRGPVEWARLVGRRRHPIGAVVGEKLHPLAEAPLVEQPRLVDQEFFERRAIDAGNGGRCRTARGRGGHAASRLYPGPAFYCARTPTPVARRAPAPS